MCTVHALAHDAMRCSVLCDVCCRTMSSSAGRGRRAARGGRGAGRGRAMIGRHANARRAACARASTRDDAHAATAATPAVLRMLGVELQVAHKWLRGGNPNVVSRVPTEEIPRVIIHLVLSKKKKKQTYAQFKHY